MTSPALFRPKAVGAGLVVNALTKYIGGHGNALAGSVTDTGLFDWTRYPEHRRELQVAAAGALGHPAAAQEGPARLGRHAGGRARRTTSPSAPRRSRCGWSAPARTRRRSPSFSRRTRRCAPSTTRACRRIRSTRSRSALFRGFGGLFVVRARRRHRLLRFPQPPRHRRARRRTWATTGRSRSRSRTRSSGRWAPSAARRWASPIR